MKKITNALESVDNPTPPPPLPPQNKKRMNIPAGSKNFANVAVVFASICFLLVSQLFLRAEASSSIDCNPITGCCRGPNDPPCTWFLKISVLSSAVSDLIDYYNLLSVLLFKMSLIFFMHFCSFLSCCIIIIVMLYFSFRLLSCYILVFVTILTVK